MNQVQAGTQASEERGTGQDLLRQSIHAKLEELFTQHLRSRLLLKEVIVQERDLLTQIVAGLEHIPAKRRGAVVQHCVDHAAATLICDSQ